MGFGSQTCPVRVAATSCVGRNVGLGSPGHDSGGGQQGLGGPVRPYGHTAPGIIPTEQAESADTSAD